MSAYNFLDRDPEVNALSVEGGAGSGSWDSAQGILHSAQGHLAQMVANVHLMGDQITNSSNSETASALFSKLAEVSEKVASLSETANNLELAAKGVANAYNSAERNIVSSEEVAAAKQAAKAVEGLENNMIGGAIKMVRSAMGKPTAEELNAVVEGFKRHNGIVLNFYSDDLDKAMSSMETATSQNSQNSGSGVSGSGGSGAAGTGGGAGGGGSTGGGGGSAGGGGSYGGGYAGYAGGSYGGSRIPTSGRAGSVPRFGYDPVTADDINLEDYLGKYTTGTESGRYGGGYGTGRELNFDRYTGSGYTAPEFNPSEYTPPEYDSSDIGSRLSNFTPTDFSANSGPSTNPVAHSSSSPIARTGLSYSNPNIGIPGGMGGLHRVAGAGTLNPGAAFRAGGTAGSPAAMTGGLGMLGGAGVANSAAGFGGVQATPANGGMMRGGMGMMPMGAAGARGGSGGRGESQGETTSVRSADNDVLDGISAIGVQRSSRPVESDDR